MPCSCSSCLSGVKGGAAQKVVICDLDLVQCGAVIPGLGDVTGTIEAAPSSISASDAQDAADMIAAGLGMSCSYADAYTTWPTDRSNILLDDGNVWPIGSTPSNLEGLFRVNFDNPFAVCPTATISLIDILVVYEAFVLSGGGTSDPGIAVAWRKANNDLVTLTNLAGANAHNTPVRTYIPAIDTITIDDLVNGYGLVGLNLSGSCNGTNNSRIDFDYIGARFTYDATVCYDPSDPDSGGTRALPVSVICDGSSSSPTTPIPTIDWDMQSGTATVPTAGSVIVSTNPNMHVMSVYNPGANSITVDFETSAGSTAQQIIPPSSNYTFGVGDDFLSFGTNFTFNNAGGSNIDIIWNVSTTGG